MLKTIKQGKQKLNKHVKHIYNKQNKGKEYQNIKRKRKETRTYTSKQQSSLAWFWLFPPVNLFTIKQKMINKLETRRSRPEKASIIKLLTWGCFVKNSLFDSLFLANLMFSLRIFFVSFAKILCMAFYSLKMKVWNGLQMMWDSFQNPNFNIEQCYEFRFGPRFGLSIGTEYFDTGLFWHSISECFGITLFYNIYIYIYKTYINY